MALFNDHQIRQLARFLVEDHGSSLCEEQLTEEIGLILEDVAGCESTSDTVVQTTIDQLRRAYYDLSDHTRESQQNRRQERDFNNGKANA